VILSYSLISALRDEPRLFIGQRNKERTVNINLEKTTTTAIWFHSI